MKRKMFSKGFLPIFMVATLLLTSCGSEPAETTEPSPEASEQATATDGAATTEAVEASTTDENLRFAVITQALNSEYWNGYAAGAKQAGKDLGVDITVNGPLAETMVTEQIAMIEAEISQEADGIIVAANQPDSIIKTFEMAEAKGVPIVESDVECNWDGRVAYVGSGNYQGGHLAGEWMTKNLPEGSKVAVIRGALGDPTHDLRVNGFTDAIKEGGDKIEIVTVQPANSERGKAVGVMENILQSSPDLAGVFCSNDEMALGARVAAEGAQKPDVKVIGFDGNMEALESIKGNGMAATVSCSGYDIAYLSVQTMYDYVVNGKVPDDDKRILLEPILVDNTNVDENIVKMEEVAKKVEENSK